MGEITFDFTERIVMVTGANGNLGSAIASAFADAHAHLILVGRDPERVRGALPELVNDARAWVAPATDLTDPAATQATVDAALARFGRLDVLVNTVGGYRAGRPVHEMTLEDWEFMMTLNARTAFIVSRAVVPAMIERSYGRIIHTASGAALEGRPRSSAYAASKSAVLRLTESLAAELKGNGINVNCVLPGTLDTPENREAMPKANRSRWVTLEDVARVYLFLASEAAQALHGALIPAFGRG